MSLLMQKYDYNLNIETILIMQFEHFTFLLSITFYTVCDLMRYMELDLISTPKRFNNTWKVGLNHV